MCSVAGKGGKFNKKCSDLSTWRAGNYSHLSDFAFFVHSLRNREKIMLTLIVSGFGNEKKCDFFFNVIEIFQGGFYFVLSSNLTSHSAPPPFISLFLSFTRSSPPPHP